MSDSKWSFELAGSWSSEHEPTESGITAGDAKVTSNHGVIVAVAAPQESMNLEGGSPVNHEGEFLPGSIRSKIWESGLTKLRSKYQIPSSFEPEIPLNTGQACNPPPGQLTLDTT